MAGFNFRYERLLNIKKEIEDEIKNELAVEIQKMSKLKRDLNEKNKGQKEYLKKLNSQIEGGISAAELKRLNGNKNYYSIKIKEIKNGISNQKNRIIKKRKELNLAVQETKKYEKLKEKRFEKYKDEMEKLERKEIEEIVNFKNYKMSGDKDGK